MRPFINKEKVKIKEEKIKKRGTDYSICLSIPENRTSGSNKDAAPDVAS
jgi:hypothetical protein